MSEDIDDYDDDETGGIKAMRARIKTLEAEAKKAAEAEQRASAAERKLVIAEAGIKLNGRQLNALTSVHEGEWDADSIRATAVELGFVQPAPDDNQPDLEAHDRVARAGAGATGSPDTRAEYEEAMAKTRSVEEAMQVMRQFNVATTVDHR